MKAEKLLSNKTVSMIGRLSDEIAKLEKASELIKRKHDAARALRSDVLECALESLGFKPEHFKSLVLSEEGLATWDDGKKPMLI